MTPDPLTALRTLAEVQATLDGPFEAQTTREGYVPLLRSRKENGYLAAEFPPQYSDIETANRNAMAIALLLNTDFAALLREVEGKDAEIAELRQRLDELLPKVQW